MWYIVGMKSITVIGVSIAALVVTVVVYQSIHVTPHPVITLPTCWSDNISSTTVIDQVNTERAQVGLQPLAYNGKLETAAVLKGADMTAEHYWAHVGPDGKQPWDWMQQTGYPYVWAGENLAEGYATNRGVIEGWMESPTHRANVLNPHYREAGVSVSCGVTNKPTTLVVMEFGSPH
jgi:uncharacterized protein YkwD